MIAQIFAMATCIVRVSLQQQYKSSKSYTWECDQLRIRQCGDQMIEVEPCPMSNVQWPMSSVNLWLRALLSSGQDYYQGLATLFKSNNDKIIRTGSLSEASKKATTIFRGREALPKNDNIWDNWPKLGSPPPIPRKREIWGTRSDFTVISQICHKNSDL